MAVLDLPSKFLEPSKVGTTPLRILKEGGNRHEPTQLEMFERGDVLGQFIQSTQVDARFLRLLADVCLDQDRHPLAGLDTGKLQSPCQFPAIDTLDDVEKSDRLSDLVRLKVPDQMPLESRSMHLGDLALGLLDAILAKHRLTEPGCLFDPVRGKGLRDRQYSDLGRIAFRPSRRRFDRRADFVKTGCQRAHVASIPDADFSGEAVAAVSGSCVTMSGSVTKSRVRPARFITFEGTEGSGKTLQLQLLCRLLESRGIPFRRTFEPGGTRFGSDLRRILLHSQGAPREPLAELLLYLADRYQHLKEVVEPALREGCWVFSDRYHDATLAYQGYARGIGLERADRIAALLDIPRPDLTVLIDVPVELGLERARSRNRDAEDPLGRFEAEEVEFHRKVREGYLTIAAREPDRFLHLDGQGAPEVVFERLKESLLPRILP